jgi:HEAT repeat protein/energy-coupling factor transporter ATP-binding protein EcfA2
MESWRHWDDFLKIMSRDNRFKLSDAETESFLLQFARQNLGKLLKEISTQLPQMEDPLGTHKKRMTEVYSIYSKNGVELKPKNHKSKALEKWLETKYSQWLSDRDSDSALSSATTETLIDWRNICLAMLEAEKQQRLTTNQLMDDDDEHFNLEEIHVPLALVERKKPNLIGGDTQAEQGSRLYEPEYEEKQRFEHEQFLEDILKDGKGKHNGKRIAIIGEPGAGKTTLLHKIAFWVQENTEILPISISLADLLEANPKQEFLEQFLLDKWLKAALPYISLEMVEVTEALKTELKKLCNQGRVWLLLDGVDEMPVHGEEPLWAISNQLKGWVGQAPVVLTCRLNVWEANRNVLADNFEIYRTLEFSYGDRTMPDRVGEFIAKWFNKQPDLGQQLRQALDEPGKERIKDLAKNPLRLALLCSTWNLWRDRGGLPDTKAKLYQGFVEKFYEWKGREFPTNYTQREQLNWALGELAKLAIDQTTSRFRLKHSLVCQVLGKPDQPLYKLAVTQLNWLNNVGLAAESPDEIVYAFWHPTFEEYFAALAVGDRDFFLPLPRQHQNKPVADKYRIFEPQWKEVILLWLGRENIEAQKQEFIDALVNFDDGCGEWEWENIGKGFYEYRAYFLAASGINEFKSHSLANKIVNQLVNLGFGYFSHKKLEWQNYIGVISGYVMINKILTQTDKLSTLHEICSLLENPQYPESSYRRAISVLGEIGQGDYQSISVLNRVLNNTKNPEIKRQVLISLNKIESGQLSTIDRSIKTTTIISAHHKKIFNPENIDKIQHFIELLLNEKSDNTTRMDALTQLKRASQEDSRIINALVEVIEKANDPSLRYYALHCLDQIDRGGIAVTRVSMKIIENFKNEDEDVLFKAVRSLKQTDMTNDTNSVDCLLSILTETNENKDKNVQITLLEAVGKVGHDNPKAIDKLTGILANTKDEEIRFYSADSLGRINPGNCKAVAVIIEILENTKHQYTSIVHDFLKSFEDFWESSKALDSLGEIGNGSKNAIHALVKVLEITKAEYARRRATKSLLKIITTDEHRQAVVSLLQPHLNTETYENNFDLFKDCYVVLWHCAQNLPYPTFYKAWNYPPTTPDPEVPETTA